MSADQVVDAMPIASHSEHSEVLLTNVVEHEGEGLGLLTVGLDGDGGGTLDLTGGAFLVVMAVAEPFTQIVAGVNLDQRDAGVLGHGLIKTSKIRTVISEDATSADFDTYGDEFLVLGVLAVSSEHADESLLSIESLENLIEALNETYIYGVARVSQLCHQSPCRSRHLPYQRSKHRYLPSLA